MKESKKRGRKALPNEQKMVNMNIRMLPAQKVKLSALGGGKWVRGKIDRAKIDTKDEVK